MQQVEASLARFTASAAAAGDNTARLQAAPAYGKSPQQLNTEAPHQRTTRGDRVAAAAHEDDPSWCTKHAVTMKWRNGNERGPGWFSHQLGDGSYCKGK